MHVILSNICNGTAETRLNQINNCAKCSDDGQWRPLNIAKSAPSRGTTSQRKAIAEKFATEPFEKIRVVVEYRASARIAARLQSLSGVQL
jgi:hypothetical protein